MSSNIALSLTIKSTAPNVTMLLLSGGPCCYTPATLRKTLREQRAWYIV